MVLKYKKGPVKICNLKAFGKIIIDNNLETKIVLIIKKQELI